MTDIRPEHMDAARKALARDDIHDERLIGEIAAVIATATADLTAERDALLAANGALTKEKAEAVAELAYEAEGAAVLENALDRTITERDELRAEVARLKRRAACDTCCGFGHVHMDRFCPLETEPAVAAHGDLPNPHEICDDCRPCPECGGGE